jgi:hypothetical protein
MKSIFTSIFFIVCLTLAAQTPTYDELNFEADSTTKIYKHAGKNVAFVRSKRGTSGVNKTSKADSILALPITEIVLVFSELDASAIAEREEANRERWENLLLTYPEFFQFTTTYKNVCQCNSSMDAEALKQAQGFYIYFTGAEPKVEEKKPVVKAAPVASPPANKVKEVPVAKEVAAKKEKPVEETKKVEKVKESEAPVTEEKHHDTHATDDTHHDTHATHDVAKGGAKGKVAHAKPRRAKDPKSCRPPCYLGGDEDLNDFFKQSIVLSKKQKKHGKDLMAVVKINLDLDGTIKKALVTGENEGLNKQIQDAVNSMSPWNAEVKAGITVRSEIKITLKFDPESKSLKPFEVALNHRAGPLCKCISDAEMFGTD